MRPTPMAQSAEQYKRIQVAKMKTKMYQIITHTTHTHTHTHAHPHQHMHYCT